MNTNVLKTLNRHVTRLAAIVACMMFSLTAMANVITVTSANDSGEGSLRAAIAAAASGDVINVTLSEGSVIYLDSSLNINSKSLTINGNCVILDGSRIPTSTTSCILSNNDNNRLTSRTVFISRVHFRNGNSIRVETSNARGGAIYNSGRLVLQSCIFSNNSSEYGGAIYNRNYMWIEGCTFYNNSADVSGGAIYNAYIAEYRRIVVNH